MNRTQHDHRALSQQPRIPQEELDRMWRIHQEESLRVWEFLQMKTNDESPNNTGRGSSDAGAEGGEGAGSGGGSGKKTPQI